MGDCPCCGHFVTPADYRCPECGKDLVGADVSEGREQRANHPTETSS